MKSAIFTTLLAAGLAWHAGFAAAAPNVDTSTPKGTVKAYYDLAVAGDFDGLKKLFATPSNDQEQALLAEGMSDDIYIPALAAAALEKFPGAKVPNTGPMLDRAKGEIDRMVETVEADTATLSIPGQPAAIPAGASPFLRPIQLRKVDGAWKIALSESRFLRLPPPQMRALHKARCEAMRGFIADIKAGKYASFEECDKAMKQKLVEIQKQHLPTIPASAVAPAPVAPAPVAAPRKLPEGAPPSDCEFVSLEIQTTRNELIKQDSVSLVIEFKNPAGKDISALRGSIQIFDSSGTVVYVTGVTRDNGANVLHKAGEPLKVSVGYLESAKVSGGKLAGKPLLEAIRENPAEFGASLKISQLKFTDKTEENFP